ncbi:unnamed protein product [Prunus armeniaca]
MERCVGKSEGQCSKRRKSCQREITQAQMWFIAIGQGKKSFNNHQCWEVVKNYLKFKIIPTGSTVV